MSESLQAALKRDNAETQAGGDAIVFAAVAIGVLVFGRSGLVGAGVFYLGRYVVLRYRARKAWNEYYAALRTP